MELDPQAFNAFLDHIGQDFTWRKAHRCPCVNPHSGAAAPGCQICKGKSWFWENPVPATAGVPSQQIQMRWAMLGLYQDGDMVVSVPEDSPMYEMGQIDRVVALNNTDSLSLTLIRGDANERVYEPVASLTRAFWIDGNSIVDGPIPSVGADGAVTWGAGGPAMGTRYTLTGTRYSEFFCWGNFPGDRNQHHGARLPRRVILRRFDLFGRDLS